jgi:hypothetical protein
MYPAREERNFRPSSSSCPSYSLTVLGVPLPPQMLADPDDPEAWVVNVQV